MSAPSHHQFRSGTSAAPTWSRTLALGGICAVLTSVLLVAALDIWTFDWPRSPVIRTISEYALGPLALPFYAAVLLLAYGSFAILAAMVAHGLTHRRSGGVIAFSLWTLGLTFVVLFEKHDWSVGPSPSGYIHQLSSLTAFVAMPIAGVLLARPWRTHEQWRTWARWANRLGSMSLLWFPLIVAAIVISVLTELPWWQIVPLGLVERLLTLSEVLVVLALGRWVLAASRSGAVVPQLEPVQRTEVG